jgi:hypothetical protein
MAGLEGDGRGITIGGDGLQSRAAFDLDALGKRGVALMGLETDDADRGRRRQIMRLNGAEQMLGKIRKLVLQLELNPRAQKGHALQQALDMRIDLRRRAQPQPPGDRGIILAETLCRLAQMHKFVVIGLEKSRIHQCSRKLAVPVSTSTSVRISTGMACTAAVTSPRMTKLTLLGRASSSEGSTSRLPRSTRGSKRRIASRISRARA